MKKLLVLLLALAVILTACAQKAAETTAPAETPVVETPAEVPAETPVVETPAVPAEEVPLTPAVETPVAPAETPKVESEDMTSEVAIGDKITYKDTTFTIDNIANSGNELYLNFDPFILKLQGLNNPEILNNVEYKITSNENFRNAHTVTLNVKPLKLEKNQYLIMEDKTVTINNTVITIGEVKVDTNGLKSAYFNVNEDTYWVKLKGTVDIGKFSVTLDRAFYQQRKYAIWTIVPR